MNPSVSCWKDNPVGGQGGRRYLRLLLCVSLLGSASLLPAAAFASIPVKGGPAAPSQPPAASGSIVNYGEVPPPQPEQGIPLPLHGTPPPPPEILAADPNASPSPSTSPSPMPRSGNRFHSLRAGRIDASGQRVAPSLVTELQESTPAPETKVSFLLPAVILALTLGISIGWRRYQKNLDAELRGFGIKIDSGNK